MNQMLCSTAIVCALAASSLAQQAPYEKYVLPNGMTVILHEDRSLPVASINIWYGVGAQDEPPGRSGFAHLFEHLMFMGTRRVPGNQFDVLMETGGGANNASTDLHRTDYYSWGPSKLLPTLLWLDADRLEDFGLNVTQEKLDKQRDVVRNELRQVVENAPYGKADEALWPMLFPKDHPYVTGVIGTHQDLEAANVTNVKDFFANFYVPNNASLVVAGDFQSAQIKPLIADLFGTIERGADVVRKYKLPTEPIPVRVAGVKRFTAIDQVELPRVQYTFGSPVWYGPGDAEMGLAASTLASGKSSRLYNRLVIQDGLAADVAAAQQAYPLAGIFQINVYAKPGVDLGRIEAAVQDELQKFVTQGPTQDELARHQVGFEQQILGTMQSIESKAAAMNIYQAAWGEPDGFRRDIERYRKATPADVKDWAQKVLKMDAMIVTRVLPEEPERAPSARDAAPAPMSAAPFNFPAPESFSLSNGLKVMVWRRPALPLVSMHLVIKPGVSLDPTEHPGLASLTADMLSEGAGSRDALQFSDALQVLGASFGAVADEESLSATMSVLSRNFAPAAALFADAIMKPRMLEEDFSRAKGLRLDDLALADSRPPALAAKLGNQLLFGTGHPYSTPATGTTKSIEAITLEQVKAFHAKAFAPGNGGMLLVAGDVSADQVRKVMEPLMASWKGESAGMGPKVSAYPSPKGLKVAVIDRPGATQTMVRFMMPGVALTEAQRVNLDLINVILGGSFTSRLNQNLRERNGYTYGARSSFTMYPSVGAFTAGASIQADKTGLALSEFFKEMGTIRSGGISAEEAAKASETLRNETVRDFASLEGMLGTIAGRIVGGMPLDSISNDFAAMDRANKDELDQLARKFIPLDQCVLVLVGDRAVITEQMKAVEPALPAPTFYSLDGEELR